MTWKIGVLWGILLTAVEWLGYLAQRGGVTWAGAPVLVLTMAVFLYIGYSVFRITRRVVPALLTAILAGLMTGFFGALGLFLTPGEGVVSVLQQALFTAISAALFAALLGLIGALWARIAFVVRKGVEK